MEDIIDGEAFRTSEFFKRNPDAYPLLLYSDAVELANPLGTFEVSDFVEFIFIRYCDSVILWICLFKVAYFNIGHDGIVIKDL